MSVATLPLPCERSRRFADDEERNTVPQMHGRVLVADDSSDGRRMICGILTCLGLEVAVAENGRVARDAALAAWKRGTPFDLVLMDSHMPVMDGYEATALLRAAGYAGRIVALVPDSVGPGTQDRWLKSGCDAAASKPITFPLLRDVIRRHLAPPQPPRRKLSA